MYVRRGRLVLDELHDVILINDFAGCCGKVSADFEGCQVSLGYFEEIVRTLHIFDQVLKAFDEIAGIGCERFSQDFGVGAREIGR